MRREQKKEYLRQYIELKRRLESLEEEAVGWNVRATTPRTTHLEATGVKGSTHKNPVDEHLDVLDTIDELKEEASERLEKVMKAIDTVDMPKQRTVLVYRYVNDLYFYQIAQKMELTLDGVYKLHRKALKNLQIV